jgi:hypothetical protein
MQALAWWPIPLPWLRALLLLVIVPGLLAGSVILAQRGTAEGVIAGLSLAVLLAGYAGALIGAARGRHGPSVWASAQELPSRVMAAQQIPLPFSSAMEAQKWLERRRLRLGFVILTFTCLITALLLMWMTDFLVRDLNPEALGADLKHLRQALTLFGRSWVVLSQLLLPLLISAAVGGNSLGRLTISVDSTVCSPFLATRPMATADMVAAKLLTCARGILLFWALMFLTGLLWAVWMGRVGELAEHLVARTGSPPAALLALMAGVVVLPAMSWLWLVSGMGVKILRWSVLEIIPALYSFGLLLLLGLALHDKIGPWRPVLGGIVVTALVGKAFAVCWVVTRLRRERLIQDRTIVWALTAWVVLTVMVLGIGAGVLALGPLLLGIAVLMLPLARPLAAPLALARHRTL